MPKQHKYLLLTYKYRGKTYTVIEVSLGGPYGYRVEPGKRLPLSTRRYTNYIITRLNKQWINQIQIHRPNKIIDCSFMMATEYTIINHFVNKIRRFLHLHEKY
jgi:hypothetical protein